jgi:hypothetical protein
MESELMPERRPLLTIAIPTYNRADDLAELLSFRRWSCSSQTTDRPTIPRK